MAALLAEPTIVHGEAVGPLEINAAAIAQRMIRPAAAKAQTVLDGTATSGMVLPVQNKRAAGANRSA